MEEKGLREISYNGELKARLSQSLSNICSVRQSAARDVWFHLLSYRVLVLRFSVGSDMNLNEMVEESEQAQGKLLKSMNCSENLDISW